MVSGYATGAAQLCIFKQALKRIKPCLKKKKCEGGTSFVESKKQSLDPFPIPSDQCFQEHMNHLGILLCHRSGCALRLHDCIVSHKLPDSATW